MPENGKRVRKHSTVALEKGLQEKLKEIAEANECTAYDVLCGIVRDAIASGKIRVRKTEVYIDCTDESPPKGRRRR